MASRQPTRRTRMNRLAVGAWLTGTLLAHIADAQPYLPTNDDQVLERLSNPTDDARLRRLHAELGRTPDDPALALGLAREHIEQARISGDPRHLGRAEAVLSPWWGHARAAPPVLVMRAIVRQANHDFAAALADLDAALTAEPGNAQGLLTRASIHQVQGEYARARDDCRRLAKLRQERIAQICLAEIAGLSGRAETAYRLLEQMTAAPPVAASDDRAWIEGLLADIAERRGDTAAAERHYRSALAPGNADMFLLTAYADFLLDQGRAGEVVALLEAHRDADTALLRLALAAQAAESPQAPAYIADLGRRFAVNRRRGGTLHLREEARFTLSLSHDPEAALPLAAANWAQQREPADARLLLQAALAAQRPEAARPALAWLERTGMEDVRLRSAVDALNSKQ